MALLDEVLEASGGIDRWQGLERFTIQFSMNGFLLASKGRRGALKDLAAQGFTHRPSLRFNGFPAPDQCGAYRLDRVAIETLSGEALAWRDNPRSAFRSRFAESSWDDLDLVYFCGISVWNCLAAPFVLAEREVEIEELDSCRERGETWRRLKAVFPPRTGTFASEQIFYFDRYGLQRRVDYAAIGTDGTRIAQYSWAHQTFSGIVVPTLHRGLILRADGTVVRRPPQLDIEIFDAQFD